MTKALEIPAIGLATPAEEVDNKVIKAIKNIVKDEYRFGGLVHLIVHPHNPKELIGVYAMYGKNYRIPSKYCRKMEFEVGGYQVTLMEFNHWLNVIYRYDLNSVFMMVKPNPVFTLIPSYYLEDAFKGGFLNKDYHTFLRNTLYNVVAANYIVSLSKEDKKLTDLHPGIIHVIMRNVAMGMCLEGLLQGQTDVPYFWEPTQSIWMWLFGGSVDPAQIPDPLVEGQLGSQEVMEAVQGVMKTISQGYPYFTIRHTDFERYPAPLEQFAKACFHNWDGYL